MPLTTPRVSPSKSAIAISVTAVDRRPFGNRKVKHLIPDEEENAQAIAAAFKLPMISLDAFDLSHCCAHTVDFKLIQKYRILPVFEKDKVLYLATSDPTQEAALADIKFNAGKNLALLISDRDKLDRAIEIVSQTQQSTTVLHGEPDRFDMEQLVIEAISEKPEHLVFANEDETPIVKFVNQLLCDAIEAKASDIHLEPYEKVYRIRFRIDGTLREVVLPPIKLARRLSSRIKVMALLDISERRLPQDGRIKVTYSKTRSVEFRVNTLPTLWGEKLVLRVLDPLTVRLSIDTLGFEPVQKQHYLQALQRTQGLILVTGPTGSGKTISLYSGLSTLNSADTNISTAENPVELNMEGVNQLAVNERIGLSFDTALRALLRQDPDVIMVGEIRDSTTAEIAIRAAQTGHLVLSTLHTNGAAETLTRLGSMGIAGYTLGGSLSLIIAQRLARKLCEFCKESLKLPEKVMIEEGFNLSELGQVKLYDAAGCQHCNEGFRGRIGIYEVVPVSEALTRIIMADGDSQQINTQLQIEGIDSLRRSALKKVAYGQISLREANRLT